MMLFVAELCKGSTADSDSVCLGSNPSSAAKENDKFRQKLVVFSFIHHTASYIASQFYCASHSVSRFASFMKNKLTLNP